MGSSKICLVKLTETLLKFFIKPIKQVVSLYIVDRSFLQTQLLSKRKKSYREPDSGRSASVSMVTSRKKKDSTEQ